MEYLKPINKGRKDLQPRQIAKTGRSGLGLLILMLLINAIASYAQTTTYSKTPPSIAPGSAAGSFALNDFETINLYNGGLNFNLPLLKVGGRGNAGYTINLPIEHRWQINTDSSSPGYLFHNMIYEWWTTAKPGYSPGILQARQTASVCYASQDPVETVTNMTFTTVDGTEIELFDLIRYSEPQAAICPYNYPANGPSRGTTFISKDGSHITFISDSTIYDYIGANPGYAPHILSPSGYLMFKDGTKYRIDSGQVSWIQDTDGNRTTFTYANQKVSAITDSLNRQITIEYGVSESPYGVHDKITYSGTNGTARTIRISKGSLSDALKPGETLKAENQLFPNIGRNTTLVNPADIVSSVWLPDGRRYQLFYNAYADLAKVILPTGGAVEYDWTKNDYKEDGYGTAWIYSRVSERRSYPDGINLAGKTNYSVSTETGIPVVVKQLAADNSVLAVSKHFFYVPDGAYVQAVLPNQPPYPWNAGREYKSQTFTADETAMLTETNQTWFQDAVPGVLSRLQNPRIIETTQKLADTNQVSKKTFSYDEFTNVTDTYEYDFGIGAPGAFLRRTHTDYVIDSNYTSHTGAHLRSLPSQTWVSSDEAGNNKVSLMQMEYDNYASDANHSPLMDRANVSGHDTTNFGAGYPWRGNVTAVTSFANAASGTEPVTAFSQYDILGNVVKTIDAKGNASTISYNDNFGAPDAEARTNSAPAQLNGQSAFAFPTSATNALGWVTGYSQFNYFTGAAVDAEDINGVVSSNFYNDPLDRPTQSIVANNLPAHKQQTTITYDDANRKVSSTSDLFAFGDNLAKSESFYDGLGRTTESRKYEENGGYIATNTEYDALGRVKRATNPYRPAQSEPQLWTSSTYDALGRVVSVIAPDNSVVQTAYVGNAVTATDQAGKQRRSITNGLGQLTRVDEPDDAGNLGTVDAPTQATSYLYDTLGKMVKVTQGQQSRFFKYDSLGRLLRVRQPEQATNGILALADGVTGNNDWSAGFTYDSNGNLLTATDTKGTVITSTYDNLNRVTTRSYSDSTPTVSYTYDDPNIQFSKGKLTKTSNSVSTSQILSMDNLGRVLSSRQTTDGVNYDSSYVYNLAGALVEETYPSGRKVKNSFQTDGDIAKIETVQAGGSYQTRADNFNYASHGAIKHLQIGNGLWESAQFNNRLQVTQLGLGTSANDTSLWKLDYDFGQADNNGNIKAQTVTSPVGAYVQSFTYDSLDRLKTAAETSGGNQMWTQSFTYDRYGNRTGFSQTIGGTTTNTTPTIDANTNRFNLGQGYTYDAAGNVITDPQGRQFTFNGDNKQTEVRDSANNIVGTYTYDGDGKRIKKVTSSENTTFVYSGGKLVAEYQLTNQTPTTATTQYLGTDMLGSPRVVSDQNGAVVSRRDFMPFGEDLARANYGTDSIRQKFTGYEKDTETGLDFAEARYYNSNHGRFTAVDPLLASGKSANPQTFNRYNYTGNNPINITDPVGLDWYTKGNRFLWSDDNKTFKDGSSVEGWEQIALKNGEFYYKGCADADCSSERGVFLREGGKWEWSDSFIRMARKDWEKFWSDPLGEQALGSPALSFALMGGPTIFSRTASVTQEALTISSPVKGNASAIAQGFGSLNKTQSQVLSKLPNFGSSAIIPKKGFGLSDLAALTAQTGDEFAMFTTGGKRLIMRGNASTVPINPESGSNLAAIGWRWSAHTQPGFTANALRSSEGDRAVLRAFGGSRSVILNSLGKQGHFTPRGDIITNNWLP